MLNYSGRYLQVLTPFFTVSFVISGASLRCSSWFPGTRLHCCWKIAILKHPNVNNHKHIAHILYLYAQWINRVLDQSRDGRISFTEFQVSHWVCMASITGMVYFIQNNIHPRLLREASVCPMLSTRLPSNCLTPTGMERSVLKTFCLLYS